MSVKTRVSLVYHVIRALTISFLHLASSAPTTPYIQSSSGLDSTNFGVAVTLTCNASQTSTSLTYRWMLNGITVQQAAASNTYLVDASDEVADSGSYVCEAIGDTGSANSTGFTLTVLPIPATPVIAHSAVTYGDTVTLACSTASVGSFTYEFFADGVSRGGPSSSATITISQVSFSSENTVYTCKVYHNGKSSNSTSFHLTVKPTKPLINGFGSLEEAGRFSLACVNISDGTVTLTYNWYKDYNLTNPLPDKHLQTLTFDPLTFSDTGTYRCEALHGSVASDLSPPQSVTVQPQKPTVNINSSSSTVEEGTTVALTCQTRSYTNATSATYTWYNQTYHIVGGPQASNSLIKSTTDFAAAGVYMCSVTIYGIPSGISAEFQLTVQPQAPHVFLRQPLPLTDLDPVTLECISPSIGQNTAGLTLVYTWYRPSGVPVSGQSAGNYSFVVTLDRDGSYACQVTRNGLASSVGAALNVTVRPQRPSVTPSGDGLVEGGQVNLTCSTASTPIGGQVFTYQWFINDTASAGTMPYLGFSPLGFSNKGFYRCIIAHKGVQSQTSYSYSLAVQPQKPAVSGGPTVQEGMDVTLTCTSPSSGLPSPVTCKWLYSNTSRETEIPGAQSQSYTITGASNSMTGDYRCSVATSGTFSDFSDYYSLRVVPRTPTVSWTGVQPVLDQGSVTLSCNTASPLTGNEVYTWYFKGAVIQQAVTASYNISNVSFQQAGEYNCSVSFGVTQSSGVSSGYVISVKPQQPSVQQEEGIATDGRSLTLTCATPSVLPSTDPSRISYTWSRATDGTSAIPGAITRRYTFTPTFNDNGDYYCMVTFDSVPSDYSLPHALAVRPQTPTVQGASAVQESQSVTLTCTSGSVFPGSPAPTYTWYGTDGNAIIGQTSSTYSISSVPYASAGTYSCDVTYGSTTSNRSVAFVLSVKPQTPVVNSSAGNPVLDGEATNLTCTTSSVGTGAGQYKWFDSKGVLIPGQNNGYYQLSPVTVAKRGYYSCSVVYNNVESLKTEYPFYLSVKPKTPVVAVYGTPAIESGSVTLECISLSITTTDSATYTWLDGAASQITGQSKKQYTISPVALSTPEATFRCYVTLNTITSDTSPVFTLQVKPQTPSITGSSTLVEGSDTTLTCATASSSMPSPVTWAWYRNGVVISTQTASQYVITGASFSLTAMYTCQVFANGSQSLSSPSHYLAVQPKPASLSGNDSMPLADGSPLALLCRTLSPLTGTAVYTFTNADTGVNLATNVSGSDYYLGTVTLGTSGSYTCKITHDGVDSAVSSPALVLSVKPHSPVVASSKTPSTEGDTISLTCITSSDVSRAGGAVSYRWRTPSGERNSSSASIDLRPLAFGDAGNYSCSVSYRGTESAMSSDYIMQVAPPTPYVSGVQTAAQGSSVTYTCTTGFTSSPTSQTFTWYRNNVPLSSTSVNLIMSPASFSDTGAYGCTVEANGVLSPSSQPLSLKVKPQTPTVVAEVSLPVQDGGNVPITCQTASERLINSSATYTFYGSGDVIVAENVTNKTFTLTAVTLARAGSYKCKVVYLGVSSDISAAPLVLTVKPAQPQVQTTSVLPVEEGQSLTLTCQTSSVLSGGGAVAYAWKNPSGLVIAGSNSVTYTLTVVSFSQAGNYTCQVFYRSVPSDYSVGFAVTVKPAIPVLSGLSSGQAGSSLSLTCSSLSSVDFFIFVSSAGEAVVKNLTSNPLTFLPLRLNDTGRYKCRVAKNGVDSAYSNEMQLTVVPRTPVLSITPSSAVPDGGTATFTCTSSSGNDMVAEGYTTTLYRNNGSTLTQVSTASATWPYVTTVSAAQAGSYVCSVTFRQLESAKSSAVILLVKPATPVVTLAQSEAVDGSAVSLQCSTTSQTGLTSSWYKNATSYRNSTNNLLSFAAVTFTDMGTYTCMLTLNGISSDISTASYSLVVKPQPPTVAGNLTVEEGSAVDLTCQPQSPSMPSPVTYSWSTGDSAQTLHVTSVQFSDARSVTCTVSANGVSSNASAVSTIMVQVRKPTVSGPGGVSAIVASDGGSSVTLTCSTPSSVTPVSVTWYANQDVILGQTGPSYAITSPSLATSGSFKCSVTYNNVVSAQSDAFVLQVRPQQPLITGPATAVATGSTVTLTCSSSSQPPSGATLTFTWKINQVAVSGQTGATLVVNAAATTSSKQYACAATYLNLTSADSNAFNLTVQDPPAQPTIRSSLLQVSVGSTVTLTCETTSTAVKAFTYTWWKGGVALGGSGQTYTVGQAKTTDSGLYTCAVTDNSVTSATSSAYQLTVVSAPNKPTISVTPASIDMGSQVNISCDVSPFDPAFTYAWTMNGTSLSRSSQVFTIASFQQANVGLYVCVVAYGTEQNTSDPRLVSSVYAPQSLSLTPASLMSWSPSLVEGDSLSADCAAACSPTCTYRWSKDGGSAPVSSTSQLSISSLTSQSAGTYTCIASNSQGSLTFAFNLTVLAIPNTPTLTAIPLTFASSQPVTLSCSSVTHTVSANLTYTWLRNDRVLEGQSAGVLNISSFANSDTGRYTCKAVVASKVSSSSNVLELVPSDAPGKPAVTFDPATPVENSRVEFICNSTASSYRWYHDGDVLANETQQNYTIESVTTDDQGSYTCDVTTEANLTSLQSDAVIVSIKYGPSASRVTVRADVSSEAQALTLAQGASYSVPPGTQAVMTCSADCNEACGYEWFRGSTQLATVSTLTQDFTQVQLHEGNYSCKTANSIGSYSLAFYIRISGSAGTVTASRFGVVILSSLVLLWNSDVFNRLRKAVAPSPVA